MSNVLKFACKAPNCGRRFTTQDGLNTHFKLRHPQLCKNNNNEIKQKEKDENTKIKENEKENEKEKEKTSMEKIIKQISSTKLNPHEKHHHLLQPIDHKGLSSSLLNNVKRKSQTINLYKDLKEKKDNKELGIYNSLNNEINTNNINNIKEKNNKNKEKTKINKNKDNISQDNKKNVIKKDIENKEIEEVEIPNFIEEKQKKLLNNLFGQINSLEKYLEKDCEFHKTFTLPEVPDYDKMYDSDEDTTEKKENKEIKDKQNEINNIKEDKKIYEITNEMIFNNEKNKGKENDDTLYDDEKYKEIIEINLSKNNLIKFKNNKNIPFEKLTELNILNLSYNMLSDINDIIFFENLKELYINNNKIEDLSFCESLPNLLILNAENNNIITITSLNICSKLKTLKLSFNKIKYLNSTLRTIKNLKYLDNLTIKENPFLSELFSYREYFISNYPNIKIFNEEIINNDKRNFANNFYKENNPLYNKSTNRPMSSRLIGTRIQQNNSYKKNDLFEDGEEYEQEDNDEDIFNININNNNDIYSKTEVGFTDNIKNIKDINKNEKKDIKEKEKEINKVEDNNDNKEEKQLQNIIEEQNKIINNLKIELEKSSKINKEYEIEIEKYKTELEEDNDNKENNLNNNNDNDEEIAKITQELERWKKEYFELLEKTVNNKDQDSNKFSEDLFKNKNKNNDTNINNEKIIERPQTARINSGLSKNFLKLYEEIDKLNNENNKKSKNTFEDVLNEETDEEEDEGEEEDEKEEIKEETINNKENNNDNKDINNNQIDADKNEEDISDDEIENMFRKSYQNLEKMREEIKSMNEAMDKKSNIINTNNLTNNINNKKIGNKQTLKPIIVKKDNTNILSNKVFIKQGNLLPGDNKNLNENNKNASQRYQGFTYQLKK